MGKRLYQEVPQPEDLTRSVDKRKDGQLPEETLLTTLETAAGEKIARAEETGEGDPNLVAEEKKWLKERN